MRLPTFYEQNLIPNWGKTLSVLCVVRRFLVAYGKKSLEEIFFKMLLTQEIIQLPRKNYNL